MSNQLKESITVDFTKGGFEKLSLFTGRKNGKKAKGNFNISISEKFIFLANPDQVITSSYFLGLVGDELTFLLRSSGNINNLLEKVDLSSLNEVSRNECIRAIKRGIISNELYL
ncbi:hypothetical protein [Erwinia persicina]|uniref:hypothetical protein n=1 Tax=Erwinia persicina TaxID=55211 RepID=UPI000788597D|nr:hypothetical protein [Erwinia persicina]